MQTPDTGTVAANDGVPLAYARWRPQGQPQATLVLLHGWSGSRRYFDGVVPGFVNAGYDVVAYDHRFHGGSGPDRQEPTGATPPGAHVARLAVDLENVLTTLDITDAIAIGTSMGAAVLWCYAELFGKGRVSRAMYVDQAPLQNRVPGWSLGSKGCYDAETLANLQAAVRGDPAEFARGNADACLAGEIKVDPTTLNLLATETALADRDALAALMADHTQLDWRPIVRVLPQRALVVVGRRSAIFPPEGCEWVASAAPDGECVVFEKSGHWLYVEEAERFVEVVSEWVKKR